MEITRLTARVEADTRAAEKSIDRLDEKLDDAAKDRTATITIVEKGGLGKGITGGGGGNGDGDGGKGGIGKDCCDQITRGLRDIKVGLGKGGGGTGGGGTGGGVPGGIPGGGKGIGNIGKDAQQSKNDYNQLVKAIIVGTATVKIAGAAFSGLGQKFMDMGRQSIWASKGLGGLQMMATKMTAFTAAGGAVIGFASALSSLSGLLATIPAGLGAIAAAAMAVVPAFMGFMKGFQALTKMKEATKASVAPTRDLSGATRSLANAQRQAIKAQEDLTKARRDAAEALEDARLSTESAALSEERAVLTLSQAYRHLTDIQNENAESANSGSALDAERAQLSQERAVLSLAQAYEHLSDVQNQVSTKTEEISKVTDDYTGKQFEVARVTFEAADNQSELQDALLRVKEAELAVKESRESNMDSGADEIDQQGDLADALLSIREAELAVREAKERGNDERERLAELEKNGIENSEQVVAAQEAIRAALEAVLAAQENLAQGTADTATAASDAAEEFNKMSPAAQRVALLLDSLRPMWEDFVRQTQEPLFLGIEKGIRAALPHMGTLTAGLVPISAAFGEIAAMAGELFAEFAASGDMTTFLGQVAGYIRDIAPGLMDLVRGFSDIAIAAEPLVTFLTEGFSTAAKSFADWAEEGRNSGSFAEGFQQTIDILKQLWAIISNLGHAFGNILTAAQPLGDWLMTTFGDLSKEFSAWTDKVSADGSLQGFFDSLKGPISAAIGFVRGLVSAFYRLFATPERMAQLEGFITWLTNDAMPVVEGWIATLTSPVAVAWITEKSKLIVDALGVIGAWIRDVGIPKLQEFWDKFQEWRENGGLTEWTDRIKGWIDWVRDTAIPKIQEWWDKLVEWRESQGFKDFMAGVQEFVNWVKDTAIPRIQEWWDEFDIGDTLRTLGDNILDIWEALQKCFDVISSSVFIDFLGDFARLALDLNDRLPILLPLLGLAATALGTFFAVKTVQAKWALPGQIRDLSAALTGVDPGKTQGKISKFYSWITGSSKTAGTGVADGFGIGGKAKDGFVDNTKQAAPKIKGFFGKFTDHAKTAGTGIKTGLTKGLDFLKTVGPKVSGAAKTAATGMSGMASGIGGAMRGLGAMMLTPPAAFWILIAAAVAGLVYLIITHWDTIKEAILAAVTWIWEKVQWAFNLIKDFFMNFTLVGIIIGHWQEIKDFVVEAATWVWDKVKYYFDLLLDFFMKFTLVGIIIDHWTEIKEFVVGAVTWIWEKMQEYWDKIVGVIQDAIDVLKGIFDEIWEKIRTVWDWIWDKIEDVVGWIIDKWDEAKIALGILRDKFQEIWDKVEEVWDFIWGKIEEVVGWVLDKWDDMKEGIQFVKDKLWTLWTKARDVWGFIWNKIKEVAGWIRSKLEDMKLGFSLVWDGLKSGVVGACNWVLGKLEWFVNKVIDGINWLIRRFKDLPGPDFGLEELGHVTFGRVGGSGESVAVASRAGTTGNRPAALGGIRAAGLTLVGERGPELITSNRTMSVFNNSEARSLLRQATGGTGMTAQDINFMVKAIMDVVKPEVTFNQEFHTDVDSKAVATDIAWRLSA